MINGVELIIDVSFFLYKCTYSLQKHNMLHGNLEQSLTESIRKIHNMYKFKETSLIFDTKKSWRKDVYEKYKGQRKANREKTDVDWDYVYSTLNQFKEKMYNNKRVTVLECEGLEADDIIQVKINKANSLNYSVLLVASDVDLTQMLVCNNAENYINVQWHEDFIKGKLYMPQNYKLFLNKIASGNNDADFLNLIKYLVVNNVVEDVDNEKIVFIKILSGDIGDNIDSILKTPMTSDITKMRGIGKAGAIKIYEKYKSFYPSKINYIDDKWINDVYPYISEYKKHDVSKKLDVINEIKLNRKLVYLHNDYLIENCVHFEKFYNKLHEDDVPF